jgi:hypothetical protein
MQHAERKALPAILRCRIGHTGTARFVGHPGLDERRSQAPEAQHGDQQAILPAGNANDPVAAQRSE